MVAGVEIRAVIGLLAFLPTAGENSVFCSNTVDRSLKEKSHCRSGLTSPTYSESTSFFPCPSAALWWPPTVKRQCLAVSGSYFGRCSVFFPAHFSHGNRIFSCQDSY